MKRARRKQELAARKVLRDCLIFQEVLSDVHEGSTEFNGRRFSHSILFLFQTCPGNSEENTPQDAGYNDSEDAVDAHDIHEDEIAASVRRMAELNKTRAGERDRERQLGEEATTRLNPQAKQAAKAEQRRLAKEAEEEKLRQQEEARRQAQEQRQRAETLGRLEWNENCDMSNGIAARGLRPSSTSRKRVAARVYRYSMAKSAASFTECTSIDWQSFPYRWSGRNFFFPSLMTTKLS
jgi:flagellar biosynthesis GTPase FlhF